jgi:hypothetical protein
LVIIRLATPNMNLNLANYELHRHASITGGKNERKVLEGRPVARSTAPFFGYTRASELEPFSFFFLFTVSLYHCITARPKPPLSQGPDIPPRASYTQKSALVRSRSQKGLSLAFKPANGKREHSTGALSIAHWSISVISQTKHSSLVAAKDEHCASLEYRHDSRILCSSIVLCLARTSPFSQHSICFSNK